MRPEQKPLLPDVEDHDSLDSARTVLLWDPAADIIDLSSSPSSPDMDPQPSTSGQQNAELGLEEEVCPHPVVVPAVSDPRLELGSSARRPLTEPALARRSQPARDPLAPDPPASGQPAEPDPQPGPSGVRVVFPRGAHIRRPARVMTYAPSLIDSPQPSESSVDEQEYRPRSRRTGVAFPPRATANNGPPARHYANCSVSRRQGAHYALLTRADGDDRTLWMTYCPQMMLQFDANGRRIRPTLPPLMIYIFQQGVEIETETGDIRIHRFATGVWIRRPVSSPIRFEPLCYVQPAAGITGYSTVPDPDTVDPFMLCPASRAIDMPTLAPAEIRARIQRLWPITEFSYWFASAAHRRFLFPAPNSLPIFALDLLFRETSLSRRVVLMSLRRRLTLRQSRPTPLRRLFDVYFPPVPPSADESLMTPFLPNGRPTIEVLDFMSELADLLIRHDQVFVPVYLWP